VSDATGARLPPRRSWAIAPLACAALAALPVPAQSPSSDAPRCIHDGPRRSDTAELVRDAIRVLEQSGHLHAGFRVELRMEDAREPDDPDAEGARVRSVVFVPREAGAGYPLRVHPRTPCAAEWVLDPRRLTRWQRDVLDRAREAATTMLAGEPPLARSRAQVIEAPDLLQVRLVEVEPPRDDAPRRRFLVTLERASLRPVRGERDEAPQDGGGEAIPWGGG
jgi:hypothetical protein